MEAQSPVSLAANETLVRAGFGCLASGLSVKLPA